MLRVNGRFSPSQDGGNVLPHQSDIFLQATYMTRIRAELKRSGAPYVLATSREFAVRPL